MFYQAFVGLLLRERFLEGNDTHEIKAILAVSRNANVGTNRATVRMELREQRERNMEKRSGGDGSSCPLQGRGWGTWCKDEIEAQDREGSSSVAGGSFGGAGVGKGRCLHLPTSPASWCTSQHTAGTGHTGWSLPLRAREWSQVSAGTGRALTAPSPDKHCSMRWPSIWAYREKFLTPSAGRDLSS